MELSTNAGLDWLSMPLASYSGNQGAWVREQVDLTAARGANDVRLRFRLVTDSSIVMDGWYGDDLLIGEIPEAGPMALVTSTPSVVTLAWPAGGDDFAEYRIFRGLESNVNWQTARLMVSLKDRHATNWTDIAVGQKTKYFYRLMVINTNDLHGLSDVLAVDTPAGMEFPFMDNGEGGAGIWVADPPWALSSENSFSPSYAWTDSPGTNYANGLSSCALTLARPLDLRGAKAPVLCYREAYSFLAGDHGLVEFSTNNGASWLVLADRTAGASPWVLRRHDLSAYTNYPACLVRFRVTSDSANTADGWYLDDLSISPAPDGQGQPAVNEATSSSLKIAWSLCTNDFFSHYAVCRSESPSVDCNSTLVGQFPDRNQLSMVDTGLGLDTVYYYRVYSVNLWGGFSADSELAGSGRTLNNPLPFTEDFEGALSRWAFVGSWGVTSNHSHEGMFSLTDSPNGLYANSVDSWARTAVNLTGAVWPVLEFWDRYSIAGGGLGVCGGFERRGELDAGVWGERGAGGVGAEAGGPVAVEGVGELADTVAAGDGREHDG